MTAKTMTVISGGKEEQRLIDHVDYAEFADGKKRIIQKTPELHDGEEAFYAIDGSVHIVRVIS